MKDSKAKNLKNKLIFKAKTGEIELLSDYEGETVWMNLNQIAKLFKKDKSVISRHISNIYQTNELGKRATVAFFATVQSEGNREISRKIEYYNLDLIVSVGYRVNSKTATKFRQWATTILRQHITQGYTFNQKRLLKNKRAFLRTLSEMKLVLPANSSLSAQGTLDLLTAFSPTWFSLEAYDRQVLPKRGKKQRSLNFSPEDLLVDWQKFRADLAAEMENTTYFGLENKRGVFLALVKDVFQTYVGRDIYPSLEEKAAHLLYFVIKNHPFVDGNKRSAAFVFIAFLKRVDLLDDKRLSPEALTALTLLIAESQPQAKAKMIGLVLSILMR